MVILSLENFGHFWSFLEPIAKPIVMETEWKDVPPQAAKSSGEVSSPEQQSDQLYFLFFCFVSYITES